MDGLQERQRREKRGCVLFQVGKAKSGKFGGIVVLAMRVMDVALNSSLQRNAVVEAVTAVAGCW